MNKPEFLTDEMLEYLDWLRASGEINMYGAVPYLVEEFELTKTAARELLKYWMFTFSERHDDESITD